jgi:hypothetical protein
MQHVPAPIVAPVLLCGGQIHAERGEAMALDASAKTGRARVGLAEDGSVFCRSCAAEAFRGGDDAA